MKKTDWLNGGGSFSTATEILDALRKEEGGCGVVVSHRDNKFVVKGEPIASSKDLKTLLAEVQKRDSRAFIVRRG